MESSNAPTAAVVPADARSKGPVLPASSSTDASEPASSPPPRRRTMDVDDAIIDIGVGRFHYRMLVLVGIIFGAEAMEVLLLTFIRDGIAEELGGTAVTLSLVPAAMFTGMFVGALAWGIIADTIGRQRTLHWLVAVQIAGGMAACLSQSLSFLIVMRFVVGVGLGGGHIAPSLLMELLPPVGREKWIIITYSCWSFGVVVQSVMAFALHTFSWRVLAAASVTPYIACAVMLRWCVESPKQLVLHGRQDEAATALRTVARVCGKDAAIPADVTFVNSSTRVPELSASAGTDNVSATGVHQQRVPTPSSRDPTVFCSRVAGHVTSTARLVCATPAMRWLSAVLWVIWMGTAFAYYGIVMLTTDAFIGSKSSNADDESSAFRQYGTVALLSAAELPCYVVMYVCAKRFGRKMPLIVSPVVGAVTLLCFLALHDDGEAFTSVGNLVGLLAAFIARGAVLTQFELVYLYSPEAYPTAVRTAGTGACSAIARIATTVAPFVAYPLHDVSPAAPYYVFAAVLVVSAVAGFGVPFETKDRVLDDGVAAPPAVAAGTTSSKPSEADPTASVV